VNYELEQFGLAIRCPRTDKSALLVAQNYPWSEEGAFLLETAVAGEPGGSRKRQRVMLGLNLPIMDLMAYDGSRSFGVNWYLRLAEKMKNDHFRR
jgi:hypothetical protein